MKIMMILNDTTFAWNLRKEILAAFIEKGWKVVLLAQVLNFEREFEQLGVNVVNVDIDRRGTNPATDIKLFSAYLKILNREKPDVVLINNTKPNVYAGTACQWKKIHYISNITGVGTSIKNEGKLQKLSIFLYKHGVSKADCLFFQNQDNQQFFKDNKMIPEKANEILLPGSGVSLEKFTYKEYPDPSSVIIFSAIGRIMKDKGTDEYLSAAEIVKEKYPNTVFRLIGSFDDDYQQKVERAENKGIIEYFCEQKDIRPYIDESWAIIQPSHHEGMSNILLESAASGRPVIATDVPGCRETFDEGISGYGFPVGDHRALADRIVQFINIPYEEKVQMGKSGRLKMETEFDRKIVACYYIEEIERICGEK